MVNDNNNAPTTFTDFKIAIIGLGYVGLPLAVEFAKKYKVIGFDINAARIAELNNNYDRTREIAEDDLQKVLIKEDINHIGLLCSSDIEALKTCNTYIVTVPTPIDKNNRPDLTPLYKASATVGKVIKQGDIIIYESTVYPGVTEDECAPVLEKESGLKFNEGFFLGYSPERINPGDKKHTVSKILKITSGSTPEIAEKIDGLYGSIIEAGTFKAASIKVAEAAKVIENAQRDINIAFINELAKIFNRLDIATDEVLAAANTKWNFLDFKPGLVGGHCIGVDPYYLAQKAQEVGYHPEIILAGRRLNDGIGEYVAHEVIKLMILKNIAVKDANVLVLGVTFKENCPDVRNTKVVDIINTLKSYNTNVSIYDPLADPEEVKHEYGLTASQKIDPQNNFDVVILAVSHDEFMQIDLEKYCKPHRVIYDVKSILPKALVDGRL
ncbi:nucleotide sugar dehydrogenase [Mucilaginibacter polytrichastri]|uniref:Vi polysaccharide biosynthesis protein vipA/tviB n=1 Tax=Mucilaginibacter polytrichastri TaxID=1302689 RepID=A0A1Q6A383_9SPHI|nr:nucleotide sugar dehydrogenase [Mucilaginibacter polytrichastri]OKS88470.1 Vi polysaccharide biosynthesis protein vipA/tviB [Mucilaginibacter polytrichastri]SFT12287.1 UDP-N-acetyl-D-galactosamine dehydrogenase [Mucilaginibacter polytrichastri]